jgi:GMP synthase-like glutamine amidotransferase
MKIGILETGLINEKLCDRYDSYPLMFTSLLDRTGQEFEYQSYSVIRGEMPGSIHDCNGWLITGSRHGAYEKLGWMLALEDFIRDLYRASVPLVGICFGHQIIAQALGGEVVKSEKGWSIGVPSYDIDIAQDWMSAAPEQVHIYSFHQDQITVLPPGASVFSSSVFCPYAGLSYGDSIISVQAHPEFEEEYILALIDIYGGNAVPQAVAAEALDKIQNSGLRADTQMLADWLGNFFTKSKN